MADGLDLIDIYAEEEFIQDSEFAAEQVDLYDDVLAATVAPSDEQKGPRRVSQSPAPLSTSSSGPGAMGDSSMAKSNNQSMATNFGMRKRSSVYVGHFAWWTTDQQLETIVRSVGVRDFIELKFAENRANGQSKGYAEIVVGSESSAAQLIASLANRKVAGDPLVIRAANKQNLSFFEAMSRKRIPPRAKDSMDGVAQPIEKTAPAPIADKPPNVMPYFNRPPFVEAPRVPVMNMPHMMSLPPPVPPRAPPPMAQGFRGPMPPPGLQYQQMMAPPPRLPPHMQGPPPGAVPPALHLNPAFFPPPNTTLAPPPNPYDNRPPNPYDNRPPNPFNNRPPNPFNNRPPNPFNNRPPNPYDKGPPNPFNKGPPSPYGKMMNSPYGSKEMGPHGPGMSEEEFEEIMNRNRAISSSAISKAVSGASSGEYSNAAKTLQTAIAVIKESRVANDARCRVLLSSLKDCLRGIEAKAGTSSRKRHRSRERSTSRPRESRRHRDGLHTEDRPEEYYERHRERDRHR